MNFKTLFLLTIIFIFTSCSSTNFYKNRYKEATVSWYGEKYHKKKAANGQIFNMHHLTGAHKTLPFGTLVEIINPENNKRVIIKIIDRGPFVKGREFDLSKKAFSKIAPLSKGTIKVRYKILG